MFPARALAAAAEALRDEASFPRSRRALIMLVSVGGHVHAQRPLNWTRQMGYETVFVDTLGACDRRGIPGESVHFPRFRGERLLNRLLGTDGGRLLADAMWSRSVSRLLKRWRPDIVHCHWIGRHACLLARVRAPNLVLTAWGSDINCFFDNPQSVEGRSQVGRALASCRAVTGDAEDVRRKAETLAGRRLNWLFLPLGIETQPFRENRAGRRRCWRERLGVPPNVFLFASIRAWAVTYRHDKILEAFAQACNLSRIPLGLLFKVYVPSGGAGTPEDETRIQARVAELGLQERVWWVRDVLREDLPALYAAADAIVNFPRRDALPVTFFEAAAAAKPVVTCWHEAYELGLVRNSFLVTQGDGVDSLADAMAGLALEVRAGCWEGKLASAEREVEERYSESASASALAKLYARLLAASG